MPTALHLRSVDSVAEFEAAASDRFRDAELLHKRSRDLAAIYLWGYSVEMRVKAVYFRSAGFTMGQAISDQDRRDACDMFGVLGLLTRPGPHDIAGWAQLAVAARTTAATPFPLTLANDVVNRATGLYLIWRETLRYRATVPLLREVSAARSIATWFQTSYPRLA